MSCCRKNDGYIKVLDAFLAKAEELSTVGRAEDADKMLGALLAHFSKDKNTSKEAAPKEKKPPHGPQAPEKHIQKALTKYYTKCMAGSTYEGKKNQKEICSRTAWSIVCSHKYPDYDGCTARGRDLDKKR